MLSGLQDGVKRYAELRAETPGISEKMLTQALRSLERDGLVSRKDYGTVPPKVEYALTELGRSLTFPLQQMCSWTDAHADEVAQARARYDVDNENAG